jgi:hypothetical protein
MAAIKSIEVASPVVGAAVVQAQQSEATSSRKLFAKDAVSEPVTIYQWLNDKLKKQAEKCMPCLEKAVCEFLQKNKYATTGSHGIGAICSSNVLEINVRVDEYEPVSPYIARRNFTFFNSLKNGPKSFLVACVIAGVEEARKAKPALGEFSFNNPSMLVVLPTKKALAMRIPQIAPQQPPHLDQDPSCFQIGLTLSSGHPTTMYYPGKTLSADEALSLAHITCEDTRAQLKNDGFFHSFCTLLTPVKDLVDQSVYMTPTGTFDFGDGYIMSGSVVHRAPKTPTEGYQTMRAVVFMAATPLARPTPYDNDEQWSAPIWLMKLTKGCLSAVGKEELARLTYKYYLEYANANMDVKDNVQNDAADFENLARLYHANKTAIANLVMEGKCTCSCSCSCS